MEAQLFRVGKCGALLPVRCNRSHDQIIPPTIGRPSVIGVVLAAMPDEAPESLSLDSVTDHEGERIKSCQIVQCSLPRNHGWQTKSSPCEGIRPLRSLLL